MHDGWVSSSHLPAHELNKLVSQATGFELQVEATQMPSMYAHVFSRKKLFSA